MYIGGAVSLALGAGALAWAVVAHVERESLAQQWNRGDCSGSGDTRASVCASERSDISRYETTAAVLYGVGGAALVTGLVLIAMAPRRATRADTSAASGIACTEGPGQLGLACRWRF